MTHARQGAPVEQSGQPYPVVIYMPGHGDSGEQGTAWVEDLASHGYVVVAFNSTYEAVGVEFPDGRLELECNKNERPELVDCDTMLEATYRELQLRRMDAQFVIDKLSALATSNSNPDAEQRVLPDGLQASLDLDKIGIFGHSLGGAVAPYAMANDARFDAGINLDGGMLTENMNSVPPKGLTPDEEAAYRAAVIDEVTSLATRIGNRPYMIMASPTHVAPPRALSGSPDDAFYSHYTGGLKRFLHIAGVQHGSFTDSMWLYPQLGAAGLIPWAASTSGQSVENAVGTIEMNRGVAVNRAFIRSFFNRTLKDSDDHLLDSSSTAYPEVTMY